MDSLVDRRGWLPVVLASAAFVVLQVVFTIQIRSEGGQVVFALFTDLVFGYVLGHLLAGRSRATFALVAASVGAGVWVFLMMVELIFYSGAAAYPAGTWFVRFGLAGGLVLAGGVLFGDLVARKKVTVNTAVLASALTIVGGIVALFK